MSIAGIDRHSTAGASSTHDPVHSCLSRNIAHLQEKNKSLLAKKLRKRYEKKHLRAHVLEIASGAFAAAVKRCQQKTRVYAVKKWMYKVIDSTWKVINSSQIKSLFLK